MNANLIMPPFIVETHAFHAKHACSSIAFKDLSFYSSKSMHKAIENHFVKLLLAAGQALIRVGVAQCIAFELCKANLLKHNVPAHEVKTPSAFHPSQQLTPEIGPLSPND